MSKKRLHYLTSAILLAGTLVLSNLCGIGCARTSWDSVSKSNNIAQYWKFIEENPKDPDIELARAKIASLEYRAALKDHTRYAFNTFLERNPDAPQVLDVRRLLESMDFEEAKKTNTYKGWKVFLTNWPTGENADEALNRMNQAACINAQSGGLKVIENVLRSSPEISCREKLESLKEKLLFEEAVTAPGTAKMVAFLHSMPNSSYTSRVRKLFLEKNVEASVKASQFNVAETLITTQAPAEDIPDLMVRVRHAEADWLRSSFDPETIRASFPNLDADSVVNLEKWLAVIKSRPSIFLPLKQATAFLRAPLVDNVVGDTSNPDPLVRWNEADELAFSPQEQTASALLDLIGDSNLEVQRRAFIALRQLNQSLGPVLAESWIEGAKARYKPLARSGVLLLKLAVLDGMGGHYLEASDTLEKVLSNQEESNLFAAYLLVDFSRMARQEKAAASAASRFSLAAQAFAGRRTEGWEEPGGLGTAEGGWLSLRQVFGILNLWQEVLSPFGTDARANRLGFEDEIGPWMAQAVKNYLALSGWFKEEEDRWARGHPQYIPCGDRMASATVGANRFEKEQAALLFLLLDDLPDVIPTVRWAECCHPRPSLRVVTPVLWGSVVLSRAWMP